MSVLRVGLLRSRLAHLLRAALFPIGMIAVTIASAVAVAPVLMVMLPFMIIIGVFLAMRFVGQSRPVLHDGALSVHDEHVFVGARPIVARERVSSGVVMPGPEGTFVRLERSVGAPVDLRVENVDEGRAALDALGLDPAHAVARFHVLATTVAAWRRRVWWALGSVLPMLIAVPIMLTSHNPVLLAFVTPLVVAMALSTIVPARVTVGVDGISACRFGRDEFIPLDGIVDAAAGDGAEVANATVAVVRLFDENGAVVRELVVDQKKKGPFTEAIHAAIDSRAEALAERIREVIAIRNKPPGTLDPRTLARGDREVTAWVSELRMLLRRARGFRDADAPTPDALLAIVEDGSAPPIHRAAAAIALAPSGPEQRRRVRIAAETTAAPALRIALEAAVEHDEQKLASALEEIERAREA